MSGLRIKYYAKSGQLRSAGAPPNGMVAIDIERGSFIVHPKAQPRTTNPTGLHYEYHVEDPVADGGATLVSVEELVEAASDERTALMLYTAAMMSIEHAHRLALEFNVEALEAMARLARETRDQLAVNGYISRAKP